MGQQARNASAEGLSYVSAELAGIIATIPTMMNIAATAVETAGILLAMGLADARKELAEFNVFQNQADVGFYAGLYNLTGLDFFRDRMIENVSDLGEAQVNLDNLLAGQADGMEYLDQQLEAQLALLNAALEQRASIYDAAYKRIDDIRNGRDTEGETSGTGSEDEEDPIVTSTRSSAEQVVAIWRSAYDELNDIQKQGLDLFTTYEDSRVKAALTAMDMIASSQSKNSKTMFRVQQLANAGLAVMNTAEGVTEALPNFPLAAAVALSGATHLATILSASPSGGGSVSAPSSGVVASQSSQQSAPASSSINATDQTANSVQRNNITFSAEDGDELAEAFARVMQRRLQDGQF